MPTNTIPIDNTLRAPTILNAGLAAAVAANGASATIGITHIALGNGRRVITGFEAALVNEMHRASISGSAKIADATWQVFANFTFGATLFACTEIGFYAGNTLFAYYSVLPTETGTVFNVSNLTTTLSYVLDLSAAPKDSVTIVVDTTASISNYLLGKHIESANPHPNAPYARYNEVLRQGNMIRNGGMEIWQERTSYNIPADTSGHLADGYRVHTMSGSSLITKCDWGIQSPQLVNPARDADLPYGIRNYMRWQYTPVPEATGYLNYVNGSLVNLSFDVRRWAGMRIIVSMYVFLESYDGVMNKLSDIGTPAEIKKEVFISLQQYFGENQSKRVADATVLNEAQTITGKWKQIFAVIDVPKIDATQTIDLKNNATQVHLSTPLKDFAKGKPFTIVTTAWQVERCLYPDHYPIEQIKPSPWQPVPFEQDFEECQRYYEKSYPVDIPVGTVWQDKDECVAPQTHTGSVWHVANIRFKSEKVRVPSFTMYNSSTGQAGNARHYGDTFVNGAATYNLTGVELGVKGIQLVNIHTPTVQNIALEFQWVADSRL